MHFTVWDMSKRTDEIRDDEIRIIGKGGKPGTTGGNRRVWLWIALSAVAVAAVVLALVFILSGRNRAENGEQMVPELFDPVPLVEEAAQPEGERLAWLGDYSDTSTPYTEHLKLTINDIPLDIYIPHNASPKLLLGVPDPGDSRIIFANQAADVRADNGKINGAYVLAGKPLAWGLSKKGYVALIDGKVTVGVADNSPLFEQATETGGYFFRQYALVDNGVLVENAPKNKAVRKAICDRGGEIMVVMSETKESFHDFAQALVDLKVDNAVYLVASVSHGFYRDRDGEFQMIYERGPIRYPNENYILWTVE